MRIYLAGASAVGSPIVDALLWGRQAPQMLISYATPSEERSHGRLWAHHAALAPALRAHVLVDSGAFSAWSLGRRITVRDYLTWAETFRDRWQARLGSLGFFTLDVIGDQQATWHNTAELHRCGLPVWPIITYNAALADLDRAIAEAPAFALGGLVPYKDARHRPLLRAWLDLCFARAVRRQPLPRVHVLGITARWLLERYPVASTDSTAWMAPVRFGHSNYQRVGFGAGRRLPMWGTAGEAEKVAITAAMRAELRHIASMEADTTRLWAHRGVRFEAAA